MKDLIERQAAIDALEKVADLFPWRVPGKRDTYDSYNEAWNDAIGRAEMEIEKLPSAQPKKRTEERTETHACDYERAVEQLEHDMLYEPTFNQDDGSM